MNSLRFVKVCLDGKKLISNLTKICSIRSLFNSKNFIITSIFDNGDPNSLQKKFLRLDILVGLIPWSFNGL